MTWTVRNITSAGCSPLDSIATVKPRRLLKTILLLQDTLVIT